MERNPRALRCPLPANYVSLAQLRERWNLNQDRRKEPEEAEKIRGNIMQRPNDRHQRKQIQKMGAEREEKMGFDQARKEEIQKSNAEKLDRRNPNREHTMDIQTLDSDPEQKMVIDRKRESKNRRNGRNQLPTRRQVHLDAGGTSVLEGSACSSKTLEKQQEQKSKNSNPAVSNEEEKPGETIDFATDIDLKLQNMKFSDLKSNPKRNRRPVQIEKEIIRGNKEDGCILRRRNEFRRKESNLRGDMVWIKKKESGE